MRVRGRDVELPYPIDVIDDPDDMDARQKYAASVAQDYPKRAEFIRNQIEMERPETSMGKRLALAYRCERILAETGDHPWRPSLQLQTHGVSDWKYHRGFIELISLPLSSLLHHHETIFPLAPIRHLNLKAEGCTMDELRGALSKEGILSLSINKAGIGDGAIKVLIESPMASSLRWLGLANNGIGEVGVRMLAEASCDDGPLKLLEYIDLAGNPCNPVDQYVLDQGIVIDTWLPPFGRELEAKCKRRIPWLHAEVVAGQQIPFNRLGKVLIKT